MPCALYLVNLPYNCTETEVKEWVESSGFKTSSIRIIRDLIAGVSPAFAYVQLEDDSQVEEACQALTEKKLRTSQVRVSPADEPKHLVASVSNRR